MSLLVSERLLALATDGSFWLPAQRSETAGATDNVFYFIYYLSVLFFVAIVGAMIYFVIKYRRRSPDQRTHPIRGNFKLEVAWSVVPAFLLLVMFVWGFKGFLEASVPPANSLEVRVTAQRWNWTFSYPEGFDSADLVVPIGRPIKLTMSSTDVLHSFFAPEFRVKRDIVPNRYTQVWFEPNTLGEFQIFCTEYCGSGHSTMLARLRVVSQNEYADWVQSAGGMADLSPVEFGQRLFTMRGCVACHNVSPEGTGPSIGPNLWQVYGRQETFNDGSTVVVDDNYIRESMMTPNARVVAGFNEGIMPAQAGQLDEQQVNALIDYLKSLNPSGAAPGQDETEGPAEEQTEPAEQADPDGTGTPEDGSDGPGGRDDAEEPSGGEGTAQ